MSRQDYIRLQLPWHLSLSPSLSLSALFPKPKIQTYPSRYLDTIKIKDPQPQSFPPPVTQDLHRATTHPVKHLSHACMSDREIRHSLPKEPWCERKKKDEARGTMWTPPKGLQDKTFLALPNLGLVEEAGETVFGSRDVSTWCECSRRASSLQEIKAQTIIGVGSLFFGGVLFQVSNSMGRKFRGVRRIKSMSFAFTCLRCSWILLVKRNH